MDKRRGLQRVYVCPIRFISQNIDLRFLNRAGRAPGFPIDITWQPIREASSDNIHFKKCISSRHVKYTMGSDKALNEVLLSVTDEPSAAPHSADQASNGMLAEYITMIYILNNNADFQRKVVAMDVFGNGELAFGDEAGTTARRADRVRHEIIVIASLIDKPTNLGGLARTCEIFNVTSLIVPDMRVTTNKVRELIITVMLFIHKLLGIPVPESRR